MLTVLVALFLGTPLFAMQSLDTDRLQALKSSRNTLLSIKQDVSSLHESEQAFLYPILIESFEKLELLAKQHRTHAKRKMKPKFALFERHVGEDILVIRLCLLPKVA